MAFTKTTKRAIDLLIPSIAAIGAAYYFITRTKDRDTKFLILTIALTWVLCYAVVSQVTKAILTAAAKPDDVKPTGDTSSGVNSVTGATTGFDTEGWVNRVHDDVYVPLLTFRTRDADLYEAMIKFGNDDLVGMWNKWKELYFDEEAQTMTEAINGEWPVPGSPVARNMNLIVERLRKLGCK